MTQGKEIFNIEAPKYESSRYNVQDMKLIVNAQSAHRTCRVDIYMKHVISLGTVHFAHALLTHLLYNQRDTDEEMQEVQS